MTSKQNWYCFWAIIIAALLLAAGFVWVAVHNPQASWNTVISSIWESFIGFVSR